ncbi:MAG: hypothetical protein RLZZ387_4161 [Chloroflexota bacterium]|jgi:hypothetical protein
MARTVVGLFDRFADAENAVRSLTGAGFRREDISILANDRSGEYSRSVGTTTESAAGEGAAAGAVGGGVLGGLLGLLIGVGALAIPGIGPVLAAGPLAAALGTAGATAAVGAGIGAAAGGVLGALIGAGVPEEEAHAYAEGVRRGGTLVTVSTTDDMASRAASILTSAGAVDLNKRSVEWRSGGWSRFDENAEPYTGVTSADEEWRESSKAGTVGGGLAGAATGAAAGSVAGPVGTVVGGIAGAAAGAGLGAVGDVAGEKAEDHFRRYDRDYRTHYQRYGASSGYTYEQYQPVYRYGYSLAHDPAYRGWEWNRIEPEARRRWEVRNPGTWERFKDSVRYTWERAKDAVN